MSVCAVVKPDTGSRTEADAARFEHTHAEPDEPHDDPDPTPLTHAEQARAREAQEAWKAEHEQWQTVCEECGSDDPQGGFVNFGCSRDFECSGCDVCDLPCLTCNREGRVR